MKKNQLYLLIIIALIGVLGYQAWNIVGADQRTTRKKQIAEVVMYKSPGCTCCNRWAAHMEEAGFSVAVKPIKNLAAFKREHGISRQMASCHTALVGGYVIEGHVPAKDVKRLLKNQPKAIGLAAPGMPLGSPGMPSPNPEPYSVYLIGHDGSVQLFARHNVDKN